MTQDILVILEKAKLECVTTSKTLMQLTPNSTLERVDFVLIAERIVDNAIANGVHTFTLKGADQNDIEISKLEATDMIVAMLESMTGITRHDVAEYYSSLLEYRSTSLKAVSLYESAGLLELAVGLTCHLIDQDSYLQNLRGSLSAPELEYSEFLSLCLTILRNSGPFLSNIPRESLRDIFDFAAQDRFSETIRSMGEDMERLKARLYE